MSVQSAVCVCLQVNPRPYLMNYRPLCRFSHFFGILPSAVARSFFVGVLIHYAGLVLRMTSYSCTYTCIRGIQIPLQRVTDCVVACRLTRLLCRIGCGVVS